MFSTWIKIMVIFKIAAKGIFNVFKGRRKLVSAICNQVAYVLYSDKIKITTIYFVTV